MTPDAAATIIAFASHLENPSKDPRHKAQERRWLDEHGRPTNDGLALAAALSDQSGTRTSFRNIG